MVQNRQGFLEMDEIAFSRQFDTNRISKLTFFEFTLRQLENSTCPLNFWSKMSKFKWRSVNKTQYSPSAEISKTVKNSLNLKLSSMNLQAKSDLKYQIQLWVRQFWVVVHYYRMTLTILKEATDLQQVLSSQDPETPWHLHSTFMLRSKSWNERDKILNSGHKKHTDANSKSLSINSNRKNLSFRAFFNLHWDNLRFENSTCPLNFWSKVSKLKWRSVNKTQKNWKSELFRESNCGHIVKCKQIL